MKHVHNSVKKNNDTKDYSEKLEFLNSQPYYASKKNCYPVVRFSGTPYQLVPSQKKHCHAMSM